MKRTLLLAFLLAVFFSADCLPAAATALMQSDGRPTNTSEKDVLSVKGHITPEILWSLGRVGDPQISPDLTKVIFSVKRYDIALNKGNSDLYLMNLDGADKKRLTESEKDETAAKWSPDGKRIGFVLSGQLWEMDPDGKNIKMLTDLKSEISGFLYSPQGDRILFVSPVIVPKTAPHLYDGLDKSSGRLINDLMYRHWDSWRDGINHIFIADYGPAGINNITDIMAGELWESPLAPFGGMEQISWSPDGKTIAYASRKKKGRDYALSTNSDIYLYDIATKQTANLTTGMMGYDTNPLFSPDSSKIAWLSMERDGYEADENRLFVYDRQTKIKTFLTPGFDQDVSSFVWSVDGRHIYFVSNHHGADQIYRLETGSKAIKRITSGAQTYGNLQIAGNNLVAVGSSFDNPDEIYLVNEASGRAKDISRINQATMEKIFLGAIQRRWVKTTDNKKMLTWVIFPPHFHPGRAYPALLYCVGGPEIAVNQSWSYRWNLQVLAAQGYVVIAPNRRGATGFGRKWKEGVLRDWDGQPMKDLLAAGDELKKEPWIDEKRFAAVGPSFGGYSVLWLAGNHGKRFKAFIAHDGIFNLETMYTDTDEMWFVKSEFGAPPWDKSSKPKFYDASPHRFVQNWNTPILIVQGERDYRVPVAQGLGAFNAAVLRGVPAELLYLPDQGHWVLTPQDSILWHRVFFDWLTKWLK